MHTTTLFSLAALIAVKGAYAGLSSSSSSQVAMYWGQNSYGKSSGDLAQQDLATYCSNTDIDVIQMAFLTQMTTGTGNQPVYDFANTGNECSLFDGTALLNCSSIGDDIATCQKTHGKTILLSIGGATYTEGGFSSESDAESAAEQIWATFGPEQSGSSALRPFGSASVDGFDFDFESTVSNMVPFAKKLRELMDAETSSTGTQYFLTAAPQCPYPDAADDSMLDGAVSFDAIFVQFYNNNCGLQSYVSGSSSQANFNFETWDNWASSKSANSDVKVFLGVPASSSAAGNGYVSADTLSGIVDYCKQFNSFGGVMMWDASQAYANTGFLSSVRSSLGGSSKKFFQRGWKVSFY